jgi:hypothetical protein
MQIRKNILGLTLLEFLVAGAITVAIVTFATIGINTLLDYKKNENAKPKLAYEALQILNEIEKNFDNRSSSLGNLLINERAYPFQFRVNSSGYPSLSFFIRSPEGSQAIGYRLAQLPSAIGGDSAGAIGLFKLILNAGDSETILEKFSPGGDLSAAFSDADMVKIANLVSDSTMLFEVHLIKFASDGFSLEYLNDGAQTIEMYAGKWTLGISYPTDVQFLEIAVGLLPKSLHEQYFALASMADKKSFIAKNGIQLARILPWHI